MPGRIAVNLRASETWNKLKATGVVPENVRRFVIDSGAPGEPMRMYWETFADEHFLEVLLDEVALKIKTAKQATP